MTSLPAALLLLGSLAAAPPPGFTPLFNGKDLTGWVAWAVHEKGAGPLDLVRGTMLARAAAWDADARKHWRVEDGELVNDGHGAYLATGKDYGDVELLVEYKTVPRADSGIYLRATPQVQIWDSTDPAKFDSGGDKGSGGLWNNSPAAPGKDPAVKADKPFGEWNSFRILQVGERTTVYLNGRLVVNHARMEYYWDRSKPLPKAAPILLQTHGGEIRWRNLYVREIPPAEANAILMKADAGGFRDLFNGKDFTGWAGDLANFEVKDGAIMCREKKGGNVYATESFGDFVARAEYCLPPGGNNGFAVRYPGTGRASGDAMCEVQVLDDTHPKHAKLDPRQYNGSAYGLVAAHRGYLRPLGEWNVAEITVKGHHLTVELNGTRVMSADLSKVVEFQGNHPHPGKDRLTGHFGFCGHSDPVAFRSIRVKRLDK